ncbi:zinc-ribbon domain-containing protein [Lactiplantibacillus plajomi]|uniref:Zinc-ribbon domain-containing protein n=1 Tax=Lactiplantibacillus plajomi TaxID=1457217 RepID=A0ABV6K6C5_9LACO|nr:zinc ribbon domain-containing protein [Lactiplantibacillus plajomi]
MESPKFCPNCGAELQPGVKFCAKCGYQLTAATSRAGAKQTADAGQPKTAPQAASRQQAKGGDFSARIDAMISWVTNNWATAIIIVIGLLLFTLITRSMFYNVWLGVIAAIAVLVWLYSAAWTTGTAASGFEQKLRHLTKNTVDSVNQMGSNQTDATGPTSAAVAATQPNSQATAAQPAQGNTVYIQQTAQPTNGMGLAGFILAVIALFTSVIPFLDWFIWFLGALFSIIGLFKQPRGFAIAGFVISFIGIIIILTLAATIAGLLGIASL